MIGDADLLEGVPTLTPREADFMGIVCQLVEKLGGEAVILSPKEIHGDYELQADYDEKAEHMILRTRRITK